MHHIFHIHASIIIHWWYALKTMKVLGLVTTLTKDLLLWAVQRGQVHTTFNWKWPPWLHIFSSWPLVSCSDHLLTHQLHRHIHHFWCSHQMSKKINWQQGAQIMLQNYPILRLSAPFFLPSQLQLTRQWNCSRTFDSPLWLNGMRFLHCFFV